MNREDIKYEVGDRVKLAGRQYGNINPGDEGTVIDIQDGIFPGDFYVSFITDDKRKATGYAWRFTKL